MFERTNPRTLLWWLITAGVVYLLLPFDLIPDIIGIPGRVDDLAAIVALVWFYRNHVKEYVANRTDQQGNGRSAGAGSGQRSAEPQSPKVFDAYAVLGVPRSASSEAIHAAYRARMKEYHPDKVAHLGEELQTLAHEKSQEIQRAYREVGES